MNWHYTHMKLILKILLGIAIGIFVGLTLPEFLTRFLVTFNTIFSSFIRFMVPFIVLFFVADGIASLGNNSGRIFGVTVGSAYISTIGAGLLAYFAASQFLPKEIGSDSQVFEHAISIEPFFNISIDPILDVVSAIFSAFILGIGISALKLTVLKQVVHESKEVVMMVIQKAIIPLLPFYIASIFAELAAGGNILPVLTSFGFVLVLVAITHIVWILIQYTIAGAISQRNPFMLIKNMLPAYITGAGTMSSVATIPVTLSCMKKNGISDGVANFTAPLCANIHMSGSIITITIGVIAMTMMLPDLRTPTFLEMLSFIAALGVMLISSPGMPGGSIMASLGILSSMLGFTDMALGLMITLYITQDSLGTATNVVGDGAIGEIANRFSK